MFKKASRSVVFRITSMMVSVILMAFVSIFSSMYTSELSEFDGKAINLSGSLRMMSYRITTQVATAQQTGDAQSREKVAVLIENFEQLLNDPVLKKDFARFEQEQLEQDYLAISSQWQQEIKPRLLNAGDNFTLAPFLPKLEHFVEAIDTLVNGYQSVLEQRLSLLRVIQTITLFATLALICLSLYSIHQHIAQPLKELTLVARSSSRGDLTQRSKVEREDELGLLSQTLNAANDRVAAMYRDLEKRIESKTLQLKRNNNILALLYDVAQQINESHSGELNYAEVTKQLSTVSELKNIDLCLATADGNTPFQHIITQPSRTTPSSCEVKKCNDCFKGGIHYDDNIEAVQHRYPIERNDINFGVLVVSLPKNDSIADWQRDLLQTFADQLALALSISTQADQQRRIALLNERSIIARELHDSLAQSLSYLKIQVTRLEKGLAQVPTDKKVEAPIAELKEGLSSAYRQLRELLTTFRLQIDNGGLRSALVSTIEKLSERSEMTIRLHYDCVNVPFSANEEIHILQIAKEALQNALNHSKGTDVELQLVEGDDKQVSLTITDNGVGLGNAQSQLNHYGTAIMMERSHSLHGELTISNGIAGGVLVKFVFTPEYLRKSQQPQQWSKDSTSG
ncbi:type IV pili methyl-accepting chemotaxis transducer N-terminal domain-containing protein [Pseudoalteromonas sp. BDTF-M6]|uniref:histidine kinase n=1 Tax=Pseudoalteromonas sp. BDTF-M6 TaxID=2796132 RepID=UPI001BAF9BB8|nr:type IV pili methyl-accepting chemotaxis transducer N-terminal domain-containing protein [Pseudoalteromonas sp. BDTF-M6]MBS3798052.1 type IV pili methyl-accepting chemotaxis transducer N-terminal domain-containing protein [Pseudoalteromonas sp. BDTF-M6]